MYRFSGLVDSIKHNSTQTSRRVSVNSKHNFADFSMLRINPHAVEIVANWWNRLDIVKYYYNILILNVGGCAFHGEKVPSTSLKFVSGWLISNAGPMLNPIDIRTRLQVATIGLQI